ncbi:TetR/AcrR family transcriptional regulator [Amycolatopsis suaedae]|uniref:TetR/AcrR family transcriptional regulator n=1 Tax=Amycolatopsis suaedae TaxID=2510978 RepID=A0A4Q7J376_9PSEU|nr:TetR/AcrR family transcriptional regulator [Amycolatopsis suaedae]RZQ60773.1 TetR/AcrR family transcriptional regulator [Amycolatopsis suaedae]
MDPTPTTASRPRDRKAQLAAVAAELFRARGYRGVGINDIAAAAGITGPALYRHFADKQAVLAHVLLAGIGDMETATAEALSDSGTPPAEQLRALLGLLAAQSVERREIAALWRWEGRHLPEPQRQEIRDRSYRTLDAWAKTLLMTRTDLPPADAELLCWAALSVFGSVSVHRTTVAKRRFSQLLVELAEQVLATDLPEATDVETPAPALAGLNPPARREQILTAATELFRRRGFHAVSMEDIGAAAGIAGPSVYRHFAGKTAIVLAICRRAADRLTLGAEHALRTSAPPDEREALRRLAESYVRTLTGSAELAVAFSGDPLTLPENEQAELLRVQRDYVAQWVSLLSAVRPELQPREARITVHAALTIANDLTRTRRVNRRPNLPAELHAMMLAVLGIR